MNMQKPICKSIETMVIYLNDVSIEDVKAFIMGKQAMPILHVIDTKDPDFKSMYRLVRRIWPDTSDNVHEVAQRMNTLMSSLRHMEDNDYKNIVDTFKKYETGGKAASIRGRRTYGYDLSRIDGRLIKRKRGN